MSQHYSDPSRASDPWSLPDVQVFHMSADDFLSSYKGRDGTWMQEMMVDRLDGIEDFKDLDEDQDPKGAAEQLAGWYWWTCIPGCMPDSDPFGPFETEEKAVEAAQADSE